MLKSLLSNKEKLFKLANTPLNENCSAVILKKLPEKLGDPGKFLIPCGFSELKCKALADLGASINLMPLSRCFIVPGLESFHSPADFVIVDYECDPRVPLILGRPFLRTARALIDVHGEEMILHDGVERLILNMRHDTSSYSNQPHKESINMIDIYNVSHEEVLEDLFATNHLSGNPTSSLTSHTDLTSPKVNDDIFDLEGGIIENLLNLDKTKDLPPYHDNPLSGSTTSSSPSLSIFETSDYFLEEFADELAHFSFPPGIDYLPFDAESDLREIEYFLTMILRGNGLFSKIRLMKILLMTILSVNDNTYDDPFDSKEEKIKDSKILIDELDPPQSSDFLPFLECDLVFYEDFSEVDALSSTNNEDKVFNPGILIHENLYEVTNCATMEKNVKKATNASLILEDFNPPLYELPFHKEVPRIAWIFEASRALGFCPSFTRASNPQLHFGNPISKSYRLTFIFKHT
ncbi:reverse transcriptase domain-containing protein [Tanacetum coccineum]